ncbi:MAG: 2-oxoacid:acceptor oxidoreductase family protein [Chloroflexi bacterium]|nr:2-oxoacid:acceptor oxidoreductase family protein [Chloroflexota bacterium]
MEGMVEIRWHGRGGQGVVTASELLAEAALLEGKFFQALPEFGAERSGAPIRAYTRLGPEPIQIHYAIAEPDVLVILDPTLLDTPGLTQGLKPEGLILVNTTASPDQVRSLLGATAGAVYTLDASAIAQRAIGRPIPNVPLLGALLTLLPLVALPSLRESIQRRLQGRLSPAVVEGNLRALEEGAQAVRREQSPHNGIPSFREPSPAAVAQAAPVWSALDPGGVILRPGSSIDYETGSWRSERPVINWDRCTHCMLCWVYCPDSCFSVQGQRLVDLDYTHCKGCGICANQCPPKCIEMVPELVFQEG